MKRIIAALAAVTIFFSSFSKDNVNLYPPLKIPALLAGNFGELRPNHFHSGLDFKTQGKTGFRVYCAEDGYVSRVLVSPWGFGRAVYVVHPKIGLTTVYGHLSSFSDKIDKVVKAEQYKRETFTIDLTFKAGEIPVRKGEVIALSGNSGSSGGPHLHMDVRDTKTGDALDPMVYYKSLFTDNAKPEVREVALFPLEGGVVNGSKKKAVLSLKNVSQGFTAWGNVSPAINAYDRMTGTTNIYGVKYLTLTVDGKQIYSRTIDRFSFDATRATNTLAEYSLVQRGKWLMWTYVPESRPLGNMIVAENRGIITIDREKDYKCKYTLSDEFGNTTTCSFTIRGVKQKISETVNDGTLLTYNTKNDCNIEGVKVNIPKGALYDNAYFQVTRTASTKYVSDIFTIGDTSTPLASNIEMLIPINSDTLQDKSKYCLIRLGGKYPAAVSAEYVKGGKMKAKVNRFGKYAVTTDCTKPTITPVLKEKWGTKGVVTLRISDNLSGVETFRGEIDGKFVLFELDGKTAKMTYNLENSNIKKGTNHTLKVTVTDACGNVTAQTYKFNR